jgi:tetratricopeptide (TPR) repeat protein
MTGQQRNTGETADPRMAGLSAAAVLQLQAAARAIRDGDDRRATQLLDGVLGDAPHHPEALRLHGIRCNRAQRFDEAQAWLRRALAQRPDDAMLLNDLGSALHGCGDADAAFDTWRRACALAPDFAPAWFNLGRNLQQHGSTAAAIEALRQALTLAPRLLPAHVLLGDALVHLGHFDEADSSYRAALRLHPACGDAWRGLANMKTRPLPATDLQQLTALLARNDLAEADRIAMGFALGKACEDHGRHAEAFTALREANLRCHRQAPWDARAFHAHVDAVIDATAALPDATASGLGREVIFIVGMPRSGSTLVEQILATHPDVEGASELPDLADVIAAESARRGQPFPAWVADASADDWQRLGQHYLERTARWRRQRPRHTDKMPENWLYAGILRAMLPAATVIESRRDALETGWSCFKQQFYRLPHFANDLGDIAACMGDCERAMAIWRQRDPQRIAQCRHEALLAEPEAQIRALLAFCGLSWNATCLDFHRSPRSVRTASAAQVRQPLRRDTARAAQYGALLDPLRKGLGLPPFRC